MRTTIDVQDDLLVELKRVAAESNRTLKDLVEDAIRAALALRRSEVTTTGSHPIVTFRGRGVQRGVNLNSMSELLDVMDDVR
jgi:Arc/MetJ family transcription regulator